VNENTSYLKFACPSKIIFIYNFDYALIRHEIF